MSHKELYTESLSAQLRELHKSIDEKRARDKLDWWFEYGVNIEEYQKTFSVVLERANIADFLRERRFPVVIDLMAPPETLVSLFKQIPQPGLGLAVSLEDLRNNKEKKRDEELNVHQLAGDITQSSTWKMIDGVLKGKKADLIMERAKEGLSLIPHSKKFYIIMANKLWHMLSEEGGVMLIETPVFSRNYLEDIIPIPKWVNYLQAKGIDATYDLGNWKYGGTLKIIKETHSPKVLPLLE